MKRLTGRLVVMGVATMFFLGPVSGGQEKTAAPMPGIIAWLGEAILPPAVAEAATSEAPNSKATTSRSAKAKKKKSAKKSKKTRQAKADCCGQEGKRRGKASGKRCEPQSLTYARQRSGIMSSRNGTDNGPMTWFASEKKSGRTTDEPTPGSVLILGSQGHGMPTGHVAYVEQVFAEGPSTYRVIFSHTNYDRRCHLETAIEARYNRATMTLDVHSGAWKDWGRGLKVAGFINNNETVALTPPPEPSSGNAAGRQ